MRGISTISSSTTGLIHHPSCKHNITEKTSNEEVFENGSDDELLETDSLTLRYENKSKKIKKVDDLIVDFLIENNLPLSLINSEKFKKLLHLDFRDYTLPSKTFLRHRLLPEKVMITYFIKLCSE